MTINSEQLSLDLEENTNDVIGLPPIVITLLKGVIYQDTDPKRWNALIRLHAQVCDYTDS